MNHPWQYEIDPEDWAAMTRMHESTHVVASEALGIPVVDVWANPDRDVAHGGQYHNGSGDSQHQIVVSLIGAEGGAQELRDRGYGEGLAMECVRNTGGNDRYLAHQAIKGAAAQGFSLDPVRAQENAEQLVCNRGFNDVSHNVADALKDRGDRLTGADVRAAMGSYALDRNLWVPSYRQLEIEPADDLEIEM